MAKKVAKKTTTKKVAKRSTSRKAPPRTTAHSHGGGYRYAPFIAIGVFLLVVGVSVGVGYSDQGEIDITATINEKRLSGTDEEKAALEDLAEQRKRPLLPDGGLVPTDDVNPNPAPVPETEAASSTASSTDESATSTEAVSEDEVGDEPEEPEATNEETEPVETATTTENSGQ